MFAIYYYISEIGEYVQVYTIVLGKRYLCESAFLFDEEWYACIPV